MIIKLIVYLFGGFLAIVWTIEIVWLLYQILKVFKKNR